MRDNILTDFFKRQINEHSEIVNRCSLNLIDSFVDVVKICSKSLKMKKKILIFGNGGSAADAQHLSTEFTVRFSENRKALASMSLATDTSALTAIGNDFGFNFIFSRQIEALGQAGDVAIGISTSGKSKNIILGLQEAKKIGMKCITFTGKYTNSLKRYSDAIISIPADNTSRIQEMHIMIGQMVCNAVESDLGLAPFVKEKL